MDAVISVTGLGKRFRRYDPNRPRTLQEAIIGRLRRLGTAETFWALHNVNFEVLPGRMVGVIGRNGAGKSTLLSLIGGVGRPDEGNIAVHGRIGALLDLGAGLNGDLTGRENVFIGGVIAGLTRREITERFDDIVAFAELETFIDAPLRTYSSGMQMRLAFSVAVHIDPDVLLIDEVLAVGDLAFQRKCLDRIAQFKENGCAILLVSHDAEMVKRLCDEAVWLQNGEIAAHGPADIVAGQYVAEMSAVTRARTPDQPPTITASGIELQLNENRFGSLAMEITAVFLRTPAGQEITTINSGDPLHVQINYHAPEPIPSPIFGVTISDEDDLTCFDTSTAVPGTSLPTIQGSGQITLQLERLDLMGGEYYLDVGIYEQNWEYAYDYHWHVYSFIVASSPGEKGILRPPHQWVL